MIPYLPHLIADRCIAENIEAMRRASLDHLTPKQRRIALDGHRKAGRG